MRQPPTWTAAGGASRLRSPSRIQSDDEEPGYENDVRVLKLARGMVTQHMEALLSPYIPTVEDPFTG
ncbi:hypothetical protein C3492_41320 [Streptomyces sp. Ru62]|nr:hypothetical protein C3492_41320 [Streptomyces sp. Ru62]